MENKFFLLSYTVNGIKNISKAITLEFYKKTIDRDFNTDKYNVKGLYGENGTGKSAIITSLKVLKNLIINRYYLTDSKNRVLLNNLINKKVNKARFEIEYAYYDEELLLAKYNIEIEKDEVDGYYKIAKEELFSKSYGSKVWSNVYSIINGNAKKVKNEKLFNKLNEGNGSETLKEQSFLSNFYYKSIRKEITEKDIEKKSETLSFVAPIITSLNFALNMYVFLDISDKYDGYLDNLELVEYSKEHNNLDNFKISPRISINDETIDYVTLIRKRDLERFKEDVEGIYRFIKIFKPELLEIEIDTKENKDNLICELIFKYKDYKVNGAFESTGVRKLIRLYKAIEAVDKGGVVFIDEFDSNIHDVYLCKLIEYVEEYTKGQLCFTTQSITVMDVLEGRKKSLDFLSRDGSITSWFNNSHYKASRLYKTGHIDNSPFNIESFDFLSVFGAIVDEE